MFHFISINNQNSTVLYSQFAIWWAKKMKGKWVVKGQFSFLCWNNCLCLIVLKHRYNFKVILMRINNITRTIPTTSQFINRGDLVLSWGLLQCYFSLSSGHCSWFPTFLKIKTVNTLKLLIHTYFFSNIFSYLLTCKLMLLFWHKRLR